MAKVCSLCDALRALSGPSLFYACCPGLQHELPCDMRGGVPQITAWRPCYAKSIKTLCVDVCYRPGAAAELGLRSACTLCTFNVRASRPCSGRLSSFAGLVHLFCAFLSGGLGPPGRILVTPFAWCGVPMTVDAACAGQRPSRAGQSWQIYALFCAFEICWLGLWQFACRYVALPA